VTTAQGTPRTDGTAGQRRARLPLWAYLVAEVVSTTGTRMSMVAIPWFVLTTTGSATVTGVVAFAETLPYVVVLALGGPVVDRFGAWRVAIMAGVTAAALVGAVPALYAAGALGLGALIALVAAAGAVRGFETSTYVLLPSLADSAGMPLTRATGLHDGMNRTAGMLGAPLAGLLIALWSAPVVLVVDAASFLVAAAILATLVPRSSQPPSTIDEQDGEAGEEGSTRGSTRGSYLRELREGFGFLRRDRLLVAIAVLVLVTNMLDQAYGAVLVPVWVHDEVGTPLALGLVFGVFGVGAVLGSSLFAWLGPRLPRRRSFAWGFLVGGAPRFFALALAVTLPPVLAVSFVAGLACGGINPALAATEYERIPRQLQARVIGALAAVAMAGIPIGGLLGGIAVTHLGLDIALVALGLVYLVTTLAPLVLPVWREMDATAAGAQASEPDLPES